MPELDAFERSLEAAFRLSPTRAWTRRRGRVRLTRRRAARRRSPPVALPMPRLAWALLLMALLAALLASLLFVGAQRRDDRAPGAWTLVEVPATGTRTPGWVDVSDVIRTPSGYLAVGAEDFDAATWTSTDCLTWERVPTTDALRDASVTAVARARDLYVGIGKGPTSGGDVPGPALWTSSDGRGWERVTPRVVSADGVGDELYANDIAALGDLFVAVGETTWDGWGGQPAIWTSTDGRTWQAVSRFDPPLAGLGDGSEWQGFAGAGAISQVGSALMVAGAMDRGEAVWRSADGSTWTRVLGGDQATDGVLTDIADAGDGTVVAIGYVFRPRSGASPVSPVLWWSRDGSAWSPVADMTPFADSHAGPDARAQLGDVVRADGSFVIVGSEVRSSPAGTPETRGVVWTSADGRTWSREAPEPSLEQAWLGKAFVCGDQLLVTGWTEGPNGLRLGPAAELLRHAAPVTLRRLFPGEDERRDEPRRPGRIGA